MVQYGDSIVYFSRIGDRHVSSLEKCKVPSMTMLIQTCRLDYSIESVE